MFCSTKFELQLVAIWFGGDSDDNRSPIPGRSIVDLVVFPIGHTLYRWLLLKTDSQLHVVSRVHSNMDKLYLTQEFQGFKKAKTLYRYLLELSSMSKCLDMDQKYLNWTLLLSANICSRAKVCDWKNLCSSYYFVVDNALDDSVIPLPYLILRLWQFGDLDCQAVKHDHHYHYYHYHYHCDHEQGSMGGLGWEAELWDAWPQLSNHSLHSVAWLQRWIFF